MPARQATKTSVCERYVFALQLSAPRRRPSGHGFVLRPGRATRSHRRQAKDRKLLDVAAIPDAMLACGIFQFTVQTYSLRLIRPSDVRKQTLPTGGDALSTGRIPGETTSELRIGQAPNLVNFGAPAFGPFWSRTETNVISSLCGYILREAGHSAQTAVSICWAREHELQTWLDHQD